MQTRTFIAAVLTAALTLTGVSASSARALTEDDVAKLVIGATALFILGKAIDDNNNRNKTKEVIYPPRRYEPYPTTKPKPRYSKPANPHRRNIVLPSACKRDFLSKKGTYVRGFRQSCLEHSGYATRHLPQGCKHHVKTRNGVRRIYDAKCLRNSGYRVGKR